MHNYFGEIIDFDSCWYYWCRDIVFVKKRCQTWLYSSSLWMCRKIFFLRLAEDVTSTHFARGISQKFGAIFRFIGSVWAYEGCFVVRLLQNNICDSPCSNYMWMHFWVLMHPFLFMMASCLSWPIAIMYRPWQNISSDLWISLGMTPYCSRHVWKIANFDGSDNHGFIASSSWLIAKATYPDLYVSIAILRKLVAWLLTTFSEYAHWHTPSVSTQSARLTNQKGWESASSCGSAKSRDDAAATKSFAIRTKCPPPCQWRCGLTIWFCRLGWNRMSFVWAGICPL